MVITKAMDLYPYQKKGEKNSAIDRKEALTNFWEREQIIDWDIWEECVTNFVQKMQSRIWMCWWTVGEEIIEWIEALSLKMYTFCLQGKTDCSNCP